MRVDGSATISGCVFDNCTATADGGCLHVGGSAVVTDSVFNFCNASAGNGGCANFPSAATIVKCSFTDSNAGMDSWIGL